MAGAGFCVPLTQPRTAPRRSCRWYRQRRRRRWSDACRCPRARLGAEMARVLGRLEALVERWGRLCRVRVARIAISSDVAAIDGGSSWCTRYANHACGRLSPGDRWIRGVAEARGAGDRHVVEFRWAVPRGSRPGASGAVTLRAGTGVRSKWRSPSSTRCRPLSAIAGPTASCRKVEHGAGPRLQCRSTADGRLPAALRPLRGRRTPALHPRDERQHRRCPVRRRKQALPRRHRIAHHLGVSAFATHAVVDRRSIVPVGDDIHDDVAALLGCAVLIGGGAALNVRPPRTGDTVAVIGLGGVGMTALMVAVAAANCRSSLSTHGRRNSSRPANWELPGTHRRGRPPKQAWRQTSSWRPPAIPWP